MNANTKSSDITSIADWERKYLPNAQVLESIDFDSDRVDEDLIDMISRELTRPVQPVVKRRGKSSAVKNK